jgi:hypothetical protein
MFGVRLASGVDLPRLFDEDRDCEEPRPSKPLSRSQSRILPLQKVPLGSHVPDFQEARRLKLCISYFKYMAL